MDAAAAEWAQQPALAELVAVAAIVATATAAEAATVEVAAVEAANVASLPAVHRRQAAP